MASRPRRALAVAAAAAVAGVVAAAGATTANGAAPGANGPAPRANGPAPRRWDGPRISFDYPSGWNAAATDDISAEIAVALNGAGRTLLVLADGKRASAWETQAAAWHAARVRNRAAWGVRAHGAQPRDEAAIGGRRWLRWRDGIGSVLGAREQTMLCGEVDGRLACIVATGRAAEREATDALLAPLAASLRLRAAPSQ